MAGTQTRWCATGASGATKPAVAKGRRMRMLEKVLLGDAAFPAHAAAGKSACRPVSWPWTRARGRRARLGEPRPSARPFDHDTGPRAASRAPSKPFGTAPRSTRVAHRYADGRRGGIPLGNKTGVAPTDGNRPPSDMPEPTLSDGRVSKNTITAQLITAGGPRARGAAGATMGVRESKLDVVPSAGPGHQPVTLKMNFTVAYGAIASAGSYHAPARSSRIGQNSSRCWRTRPCRA